MTTYRIEFGKLGDEYPVPPITVAWDDPTEAARVVARHAIPYLKPVLEKLGRGHFADCFFNTSSDMTYGEFMYLNLVDGGGGARFCPARLVPTDLDPDICGAEYDDEVCDRDPGHAGDHCANVAIGWPNADTPAP